MGEVFMWGRFATCGGFVTRPGRHSPKTDHRIRSASKKTSRGDSASPLIAARPITNRPQVKNLPHIQHVPVAGPRNAVCVAATARCRQFSPGAVHD